jgi:hypothetical protein
VLVLRAPFDFRKIKGIGVKRIHHRAVHRSSRALLNFADLKL